MNIYLIGMPGSGKSSVAKALGLKLTKQAIDLDLLIEELTGLSVTQIFNDHGEDYFRKLETKALKSVKDSRQIIACGGGIVTIPNNLKHMNGVIIYLDVNIDIVKSRVSINNNRPLLLTNSVETLYEKRHLLYQSFAHITIKNNGSIDEAVDKIINYLKGSDYLV